MKEKVIVAMSGGVDSSVAALVLKNEGYGVLGATMRLRSQELGIALDPSCCSEDDINDAKNVCEQLEVPHYVFDLAGPFKEKVMDKFADSYMRGETPNPCIECNRHIKFTGLFEECSELGAEFIATGHYVRRAYDEESGRWLLKKGLDPTKDQSYVLYSLTQEQLSKTLFPVGELSKNEVRELAEKSGFINSQKPDSQDICFIPDGDYLSFIERQYGFKSEPGDFVDETGKVLGKHKGIAGYTTGQRKGLGVSADRPLYVLRKDLLTNRIILGDEKDLYTKEVIVKDVNFISVAELTEPMEVEAKIRYSQKTAKGIISPMEDGMVQLRFFEPQRAATAGQAAVFYSGDIVVGGGTIV